MIKRKEIDSLKERIENIENNLRYLIDEDTQVSKQISEEFIIKNNCENAFKQGEESARIIINEKIDKLIEELEKCKSQTHYKKTIINRLQQLKFKI